MSVKRNRLTNSSDETEVSNLIGSGDNIFTIPYFQRAYKWKSGHLKRLETDILRIVDSEETHFLGAIIIHGRRRTPSDPNVFDVIDGQQRITTIFLYICAIVKKLCQLGETAEALSLFQKFLVITRETSQPSSFKLYPSRHDRAQLNAVFKDILSDSAFKAKIVGPAPKFLVASGPENGTLRNSYRAALRFLDQQAKDGGLERITQIYTAILESMSVVQIVVADPTNGPKIFDSLNSQQHPMTIGELVQNEVFKKVSNRDPKEIDAIDHQHWQPFYNKFGIGGNLFDRYFFPYGLIQNPNLKKAEVYASLKAQWENIDEPEEIIRRLGTYQQAFIDIDTGTNHQQHSKPVAQLFRNLYLAGAPLSTYPFLMQLSNAILDHSVSEKNAIGSLEVIESFLVRRAISGHEPTGLHAVFKRLWKDCNEKPTANIVIERIKEHKTVAWPSAEAVKEAVEKRSLYGSQIVSYLLLQHDRSSGGDQPSDNLCIEHVLPETPSGDWWKYFSKDEHKEMKDLLGNLLPLSPNMNSGVSNGPFSAKKERYEKDSMFKSTREFAKKYSQWTPVALRNRGRELAEWAVGRWRY